MLKISLILLSAGIGQLDLQKVESQGKAQGEQDQLDQKTPIQIPVQHQKRCPSQIDSHPVRQRRSNRSLNSSKVARSREKKQIMARKKLQMVWPKDGPKGREPRGFFGGLKDILGGTGPDMFVQKAGSKQAITIGEWGNWDTVNGPLITNAYSATQSPFVDRGVERYDPYSRKYTTWEPITNASAPGWQYPRYTTDEWKKLRPRLEKGKSPRPSEMGSDWSHIGPKRFRPEHDYFWQHAHRINRNFEENLPLYFPPNSWLEMGQRRRTQLSDWNLLYT